MPHGDIRRRIKTLERRLGHGTECADGPGRWGVDHSEINTQFQELLNEEVERTMAQHRLSREAAEELVHARLRAELEALRGRAHGG